MGNNFTPAWIKKGFFNESLFCDDFLSTHQLLYVNGAFFTPDGRVTDTMNLRCEIFDMLRDHIGANIAKRVSNVVDVLKLAAQVEDFPPITDRIALANGMHLFEPIGVQDAAAAVSLSPSHFSRQFKARTGYSPYEYIVLRRIDKAKYMLASTELSVKEIAYATGYNSEENFIHSFRKNVGVAPGIFRKYPV